MTELEGEIIKWIVLAALTGFVGFFKQSLTKSERRVDLLEQELHKVQLEYLHLAEFKDFKLEMRDMFAEIRQDLRDIKSGHTNL
jgi:hypothetical protein